METVTIASKVPNHLNIAGRIIPGMVRLAPGTERQNELGGFILTKDFPKEDWDQWFAANQKSHMVLSGLIFADTDDVVRARLLPRAVGRPRVFGEVPYKS